MRTKILTASIVLMLVIGFVGAVRPASANGTLVADYHFLTYDNGMPQELWATDDFRSKLYVEPQGGSLYKVTFVDGGTFETLSAKSPGGDGSTTVAAGVKGSISGGEVLMVDGILRDPFPTNVSRDFRGASRPVNYLEPFFSSITSKTYLSWGWTYASCGNGTWVDNDATETLYGSIGPNDLMGDITGSPAACQNQIVPEPAQELPQWFNPGDGRVNGQPGDRLVVDCDEDRIIVYGVNDESLGFLLAAFSNEEVLAAGPAGIYVDLGEEGVLSISGDGVGNFWAAWNGGKFNATGQGDWAKGFHCDFSQ